MINNPQDVVRESVYHRNPFTGRSFITAAVNKRTFRLYDCSVGKTTDRSRIENESPLSYLWFKRPPSFRSTAAVNYHNVRWIKSWIFAANVEKKNSEPYLQELLISFGTHNRPCKIRKLDMTQGRATMVVCTWNTHAECVVAMHRHFDRSVSEQDHLLELNLPDKCYSLNGSGATLYCPFNFPERVLTWDIECTSHDGKTMPSGKRKEDRLIQIATFVVDENSSGVPVSARAVVFVWCFDNSRETEWSQRLLDRLINEAATAHKFESAPILEARVKCCRSEEHMIREFLLMLKKEDPTAVMGYNTADFDSVFLKDRIAMLREQSVNLPPVRFIKTTVKMFGSQDKYDLDIPGCATIDMMLEMRNVQSLAFRYGQIDESRNFSLDFFAKKFLGCGKAVLELGVVEHCAAVFKVWADCSPHTILTDLENKLIEDMLFYGVVDTILPYKLNRTFGCLRAKRTIASTFKCPITCVTTKGITSQYPYYYYHTARFGRGHDVPLPFDVDGDGTSGDLGSRASIVSNYYNYKNESQKAAPYEGGLVVPKAGLYDNVAVFDFNSLYPNCIIAGNISRETILGASASNRAGERITLDRPKKEGRQRLRIDRTRVGILPELLKTTLGQRKDIKKRMKEEKNEAVLESLNAQQWAYKIVSNSLYGNAASGKFADRRVAIATTAKSRQAFWNTYTALTSAGYRVINGDTDSMMIADISFEEAKKLLTRVNEAVSKGLNTERLVLEYEQQADKMWVLNAKKYVYKTKCDPCVKCSNAGYCYSFVGMKCIKGDTAPFIQDFDKSIIDSVLSGQCGVEETIINETKKLLAKIHTIHVSRFVTCQKCKNLSAYKENSQNLPQVVAARQKEKSTGNVHVPGNKIKYLLKWTDEENGVCTETCQYIGSGVKHATVPKYKRILYVSDDILNDPTMTLGKAHARYRIFVPAYLEAINSTAQAFFADSDYVAKRTDFKKKFSDMCVRFLPHAKKQRQYPTNKSVPAGLEEVHKALPTEVFNDESHIYYRKVIL